MNANFKHSSLLSKQLNGFANVWLASAGFRSHVRIPREENTKLKTKCGIHPITISVKLKTILFYKTSNFFPKRRYSYVYLFSKQAWNVCVCSRCNDTFTIHINLLTTSTIIRQIQEHCKFEYMSGNCKASCANGRFLTFNKIYTWSFELCLFQFNIISITCFWK